MIKKTLLATILILASIAFYYFIVVIIARNKTEDIVHHSLCSERIKLDLKDLSKEQLDALIKIQDPNFYHHKGFDFSTPGAGSTTISQALVKMYYFENFKSGVQKIKQTLIARFAFDNLTPKDTILKLFINEVYLGENNGQEIKGLETASRYYMNKSFKDLTWDEYLSIVAMIRAPSTFNYRINKDANDNRVSRIKKVLSGAYIPRENGDWLYDKK